MSNPLRVQLSGPLLVFAAGFLEELLGRGYRPGTAAKQLQLMAHLSRWMAAHRLEPGDLYEVEIERFVQERRAAGRVQLASARALVPLLGYLRGLGVVPPEGSREAPTLAGALLDRYAEYLRVQRGLALETVRCYGNTARAFLADRERTAGDLALGALDAAAVNGYLLRALRQGSAGSAKAAVSGLRSLLRFLHVEGLLDRELAVTVPSVAQWRLASLAKALDAESVVRLLGSCDRSTAVGRRDFAILMLLSRLGLRIGEVAALRLEHVDWRAGELVICGKGSRRERLPLPVDVGEAIVAWLRDGRPHCQSLFVFTRVSAPHEGLHPSSLHDVVHRACKRAGLPEVGAHRLRHTAATEMLRAGSSLREVGQVLRHRSSETTSIYAKVAALMAAARTLRPTLRAVTIETLIGLLACAGLRVGQAFALDRADIDATERLLRIRDSKYGKSREVLVHDSTLAALHAYLARRDELRPTADPVCVFVSSRGTRLNHKAMQPAFDRIRRVAGVVGSSPGRWPVAHDLRHTFAVNTLLGWYRAGDDVAAKLPLLSTYLGHYAARVVMPNRMSLVAVSPAQGVGGA